MATDKKVDIAAKDLAIGPATTDRLMIGDVAHTLVRVAPLNPAGITVDFEVRTRA